MQINVLRTKIHRATVTEANLDYIGSITIDKNLMDAINLYENERVQVVNINNGARIETYVITGQSDSGVCCLNGAAARHFQKNDKVIIMSYTWLAEKELSYYKPQILFVDDNNKISHKSDQETEQTSYKIL
ncbi:MAG: aspartate 1-decarboxylase [Burkholderiales bacterium]|nr:aspartate 1-decarboxylase [Burkholderiales bacterium]